MIKPYKIVSGQEIRAEFLTRFPANPGWNYNSLKFLQSDLSPNNYILMIWDGQSYYCNDRCIPDTDNTLWTYFYYNDENIRKISKRLNMMNVSHILVNTANTRFMMDHDSSGHHQQAMSFLFEEFIPRCGKEVYQDIFTMVYEFPCTQKTNRSN